MLKPKLRVLVHGLPFATEDCVCEREREPKTSFNPNTVKIMKQQMDIYKA